MCALKAAKVQVNRYALIADDDIDLARALAESLERDVGVKAVIASKVSEALMKLNNQRFDAVLLDLRFEHQSGEQVLEHMRTEPTEKNRTTPVLVISGHIDPVVLKRIVTKVQGVLVKPFDRGTVIDKVKQFLVSNPTAK